MDLHRLYLTKNECYLIGRRMVPRGVMVHSTAVNNPRLSRYVGPDDGLLGPASSNCWNQFRPGGRQVCVHAFIGRLADGRVAAYQTLPWDMVGWHSGRGAKGSANDLGYIGFEICEDGREDADYFAAVYREAAELTAYLCRRFGLDPLADGVVICHAEGHQRGIASNHGDVLHWFPKFGKTMDDFRADTARIMREGEETVTYEQWKDHMDRYLRERGALPAGKWAEELLARAVEAGLMDGTRPQSFATREEIAALAVNILSAEK